jgi:hypothetical protein
MNVDEILARKAVLEREIVEDIDAFVKATGMKVESVFVSRHVTGYGPREIIYVADVEARLP